MYAPLHMAKSMDIREIPEQNTWKGMLKRMLEDPQIFHYLWFYDSFLSRNPKDLFFSYNQFISQHYKSLLKVFDLADMDIQSTVGKDYVKECLSMLLIENIWSRDKEVYTFHPELEFALADSEEISLPIRILDKIPYKTIYIEFAENGIFRSHFHGVFVHISSYKQGYEIVFERVKDNCKAMFGSLSLVPDFTEDAIDDIMFHFNSDSFHSDSKYDRNRDWKEFGFFIINALLYLCAENGEVQESNVTKNTYKKSRTVKNKFSELKKWECGYRYGKAIHFQTKQEQLRSQNDKEKKSDEIKEIKTRHGVTPHTRRAHWHHYRVGKGRRDIVLKWLPPIHIGSGENVATIRKVEL